MDSVRAGQGVWLLLGITVTSQCGFPIHLCSFGGIWGLRSFVGSAAPPVPIRTLTIPVLPLFPKTGTHRALTVSEQPQTKPVTVFSQTQLQVCL